MKYEHKHMAVYSMGDNSVSEFKELLRSLNEGWDVIAAASDEHALHYILRRPKKGKK